MSVPVHAWRSDGVPCGAKPDEGSEVWMTAPPGAEDMVTCPGCLAAIEAAAPINVDAPPLPESARGSLAFASKMAMTPKIGDKIVIPGHVGEAEVVGLRSEDGETFVDLVHLGGTHIGEVRLSHLRTMDAYPVNESDDVVAERIAREVVGSENTPTQIALRKIAAEGALRGLREGRRGR